MQNEMDYGPDLLTLVDEEGAEHEFEVVDSLEIGDKQYVALIPVADADSLSDDDGELIILRVIEGEDQDFLEPIEDDKEFDSVSAKFVERLESLYEIEEE